MSERPPVNRQERRKALRALGHAAARERGQVSPDELEVGSTYIIPSFGDDYSYTIISVGPKWITATRHHPLVMWGQPWKRLKSSWNGPYFLKVDARP